MTTTRRRLTALIFTRLVVVFSRSRTWSLLVFRWRRRWRLLRRRRFLSTTVFGSRTRSRPSLRWWWGRFLIWRWLVFVFVFVFWRWRLAGILLAIFVFVLVLGRRRWRLFLFAATLLARTAAPRASMLIFLAFLLALFTTTFLLLFISIFVAATSRLLLISTLFLFCLFAAIFILFLVFTLFFAIFEI